MTVQFHYKQELLAIIRTYLPTCKVWLFGSRATGKNRRGSDIDLALDDGKKIPWDTITKMLIDIEETTIPMRVDLVDLQSVDEDFKKHVLQEAIAWN